MPARTPSSVAPARGRGSTRTAARAAARAAAIAGLVRTGVGLRLVFQPIVELTRGAVVGAEALARFDLEPAAPPDVWIDAARGAGVLPDLEACIVERVLTARHALPPDTFVTVNVSPFGLVSRRVRRAFEAAEPDLRGVVIEITEQWPPDDERDVNDALVALRRRGAQIAVDDTGAGWSGLQRLLAVRPQMVKVDRSLVAGVDTDPARVALIEMLGGFASRLDAWILAEGVETDGELQTLRALGVPLAQGYRLGQPVDLARLPTHAGVLPGAMGGGDAGAPTVVGEVEEVHRVPPTTTRAEIERWLADHPVEDLVVIVGADGSPVGGWVRTVPGLSAARRLESLQRVKADERALDACRRAMVRPQRDRFVPLACCGQDGRVLGAVRIDRLMAAALRTIPE